MRKIMGILNNYSLNAIHKKHLVEEAIKTALCKK